MESSRILIAMGSDASMEKIKAFLIENGYNVIDEAVNGQDCLRKVRTLRPDLVLVDYNLPGSNGFEVSRVIIEDKLSYIILLSSISQSSMLDDLNSESSFVCVIKPINKPVLINTIQLMLKNKKKIDELETEIEELKANLNTRKEVEKAKGLLMKNLGLSEQEAFKRIQKQSMDKGIPMKDIAKAIILAYDI